MRKDLSPRRLARMRYPATFVQVLALTFAACAPAAAPTAEGSPTGPTAVASSAPTTRPLTAVKIAVVRSGSEVPLIVGVEKGFYEKEGLAVEIVELPSGGAATQALIAGQVTVAGFSVSSTLDFYARGQKLLNVVLLQDRPITQIVTRKELKIKPGDWEALRGKKIGVSGPGGATDQLLRLLLLNMGWNPEKDVQIIATGGLDTQRAALQSGQVDAQVTFEPAFTQFTLPGQLNIADTFLDMRADDAPAPLPILPQSALAAKADFAAANGDLIRAIARGTACAIKAIRADPSLAGTAYARIFPGLDKAVYDNIVKLEARVFSPGITRAQIAAVNTSFRKIGVLKQDVPYEAVVDATLESAWACR